MATKTKPADASAAERDEPVGSLDPGPAAAVRADRPELAAAVDEYAAADWESPGVLPPVDVFAGPTARYVGDGRTRLLALVRNQRETIRARVRSYPTDADALVAARACAWQANATHGVPRSDADKHRAARDYLLTPGNADGPDNEAVRALRLNKIVVRKARTRLTDEGLLTGKAAAGPQRYKDWPTAAAAPPLTSPADTVPVDAGEAPPEGEAVAKAAPPAARSRDRAAGDPPPPPVPDEKGRPVPTLLEAVFAEREWFRSAAVRLGHFLKELDAAYEARGERPGCADLPINACRQHLDALKNEVSGAMPYVACPRCRAGELADPARCKACGGKGWATRLAYQHWGNKDKAACEPGSAAPVASPAAEPDGTAEFRPSQDSVVERGAA